MTRKCVCLLAVVVMVLCATSVRAASPQPAWARHVMVASADPAATRVGVEVLRRGGNAVDAAAAVALALGVTEGYASGIGGGCFILIRMADGATAAIDGRETAPAKAARLMFVPRDTTQTSDLSTAGVLAAAVPGELAALDLAVRTYGVLPFGDLLEGAISLADTGFVINMRYARQLETTAELLRRFEGTRAVLLKPDGTMLGFEDRLVQHDLAQTLRRVQSEGVEAFYSGDIPQAVEQYVSREGGVLNANDFADYRPLVREPVRGSYRGYEIISMPPPSSGGVHVIEILNLIEPFDLKSLGAGSSAEIHLVAEAMQIAFADRAHYLGDPDFTVVPTEGLLSKEYAADRRAHINPLLHEHLAAAGDPAAFESKGRERGHTTHLCVVDSFGNAVALTATINTTFGCGVIVPGTGFFLNNEMDDFVTWPGRANYFGLVGNAANEVEPGKRPLSSMSPTILIRDGKPFMLIGSMGGPKIITSVVLSIINMLDFGMTIQEAIDFPRFHQQWVPDQLVLEPENPFDVQAALRDRGHRVEIVARGSAATGIVADSVHGGWWGAADSRVTGLAAGF